MNMTGDLSHYGPISSMIIAFEWQKDNEANRSDDKEAWSKGMRAFYAVMEREDDTFKTRTREITIPGSQVAHVIAILPLGQDRILMLFQTRDQADMNKEPAPLFDAAAIREATEGAVLLQR